MSGSKRISKRTLKHLCSLSYIQGKNKKELMDFDKWMEDRYNEL